MSREGDRFEIDLETAKMSGVVVNTIDEDIYDDDDENDENDKDIYIPNVKSAVLKKVIEFCNHYKNVEEMKKIETPISSSKLEEVVQDWYVNFCRVEDKVLFELVTAANFMHIPPLLDLSCLAVAVLLKGKSDPDIRKIFNLNASHGPNSDEREILQENEWSDAP